jgi:hypothetical protein
VPPAAAPAAARAVDDSSLSPPRALEGELPGRRQLSSSRTANLRGRFDMRTSIFQ